MSTYEKPMVMVNEELAEGVYAASGMRSSDCWSGGVKHFRHESNGVYCVDLDFEHDGSTGHSGASFTATFSEDVIAVEWSNCGATSSGKTVSGSFSSFNPTEGWGPSFKVQTNKTDGSMGEPSVIITDNH